MNLLFLKEYWELATIVVVAVGAFLKWNGLKSDRTLRDEYQKSFEQIITNLSSSCPSSQLTAAILLRRFFSIDEMRRNKEFLKEEAINVISSLLRTLPTGVFQKTVGDGLAYAKDLARVDLQRTNLQDIRLEGQSETSKLILHKSDLYMADLSYALIKYVDAEGAYFYHSILLRTTFKMCNLKNADFRNSDLTKSRFDNVELYMANFTGAVNIPKEIQEGLENYKEEDNTISKRYMKKDPIKTTNKEDKGSIYFSIPGCSNAEDNALINDYQKTLECMGYNVIYYTRDQYPKFGQLNKIRLDIMKSSAMIVFGLKQLEIKNGAYRPGTNEAKLFENKWLNTPWNEIEVGLGAMKGIPILLVKDKDINDGIFDNNLTETFITTVSSSERINKVIESAPFKLWQSKIESINFVTSNKLSFSEDNDLIQFLATEHHESWCNAKLSQGWTYGKQRIDELKQHPYLISFTELPEDQKKYNYDSCEEYLRLLDLYFLKKHNALKEETNAKNEDVDDSCH